MAEHLLKYLAIVQVPSIPYAGVRLLHAGVRLLHASEFHY